MNYKDSQGESGGNNKIPIILKNPINIIAIPLHVPIKLYKLL